MFRVCLVHWENRSLLMASLVPSHLRLEKFEFFSTDVDFHFVTILKKNAKLIPTFQKIF